MQSGLLVHEQISKSIFQITPNRDRESKDKIPHSEEKDYAKTLN